MDNKLWTYDEVRDYIMTNGIALIGDRVMLLRYKPDEQTAGGIFVPDQAKRTPICGRVLLNGTESEKMRPGLDVYFRPYAEVTMPLGALGDGPEVCIVHEKDVLAAEV